MGRAPCCDKANVKKGPWSPEEDATLKSYIDQNGTGGNWIALPQKIGLKRCGKSCRLRWLNYLRPNIKHGGFSEEEDNMICNLYISIGSRWSIIAAQLPGRTDNDIKNYWNTRLKKKLLGKQRKEQAISAQARRRANNFAPNQGTNREIFSSRGNPNFNETTTIDNHCLQPFGPYHMTGHVPFWPELPPAMASAGQSPDDSSVKNLLVKLEGRFSDGALTYNCHDHPHLLASAQGQTYQAPSFDALTSNTYNGESSSGYDQSLVFPLGLENLQAELNELINYSNYQPEDEQLAALNGNYAADNSSEGLYGSFEYQVANGSSVSANSTTSLESSSSSMANYNSNMVCDYSHNYSSSYFGTSDNQVIIDV